MKSFDPARRAMLRAGSFGIAGVALPVGDALAQSPSTSPEGTQGAALALFDVRRFGATGDGKTLDTQAINKAIDAAAAAGGGVVLFPAGTYLSFSIHLKSHVRLHIEKGATILAADSPRPGENSGYNGGTYDAAEPNAPWEPYQDYGHNHWHNSLMWGEDLHDVAITGGGLIHGKGLSFGGGMQPRGDYPAYVAERPGVANKAIALKNCRNVLFRDFSILKGGHFGLLLTGVDNVTIDNLTIDTDRDGIDIDCCQNVRVSNCTVNAPWDDAICPKSSYALGAPRITRNITITNCFVSGYYELGSVLDGTWKKFPEEKRPHCNGRIKFGTESNGGFINSTVSNCIFEGCFGIALETVDGALFEDITITNITMRDLVSGPIFLRLGARLRGPKESTQVGTLRRVLISNLDCFNAPMNFSSVLSGIPNHVIEDVKMSNLFIQSAGGGTAEMAKRNLAEEIAGYPEPSMFGPTPSSGFYLRHMRNLEMSHVEIAHSIEDHRVPFHLVDVDRADFFAVTAPRNSGAAFALQNVRDMRIGWSRAAADTIQSRVEKQTF